MIPEISVVLPMYDEAPNIDRVLAVITEQLQGAASSFEIVCVDDGSTDETAVLLERATSRDQRVRALSLSRNFGKEAALTAGLHAARGAAVIILDADLQHPPHLIPAMVAKWRDGFDVVEAVKVHAEGGAAGSLGYRLASATFYSLMGPEGRDRLRRSSDFKLLDRQVVAALAEFPERNRFFRGLVVWAGFRVAQIPFTVAARAAGSTKWTVAQLTRYASRNVMAFSSAPLRMVAWLGCVVIVLDVLLGIQTFWNWWRGTAVTGFTTVILAVLGLGGLILLSLGIMAAYLAQMYDEQKGRPVYVVRRPRESGRD